MNTDLDTRLTNALTDAANTTAVSDDAFAGILRRSNLNARPTRQRRFVIATVAAVGVTAGAGAAYAVVQDRLNDDQAQSIEQIATCDLDAETARMVATTETNGRIVDYWIVDSPTGHGDFLFERNSTAGGGGCSSEQTRQQAHPTLPWANYLLDTGDGTGLFWFHGQAPTGATSVQIVMSTGTVQAPVGTDGYFVALAELPYNADDQFERVDALSSDGEVIATGGLS
jgi:hypothetical protein